jgi:RNA polymerase sigma-70 factor (ECF subfamily)
LSAREDQADVQRVLRGDISAFEGIVKRWQAPLVNLAYRFCRDRSRAEELAQEVFLKAYRALRDWRQEAAFSTWLFALATNHYRTAIRSEPSRFVAIERMTELVTRGGDAYDGLRERDRDQSVRAAVLALPAKYRDALTLFYFHEMDVSATARSLGVPEGTIKARLLRGRGLLRAKLTRDVTGLRLEEV